MKQLEVWLHQFPIPGRTADAAATAEVRGFDGILLADSQNLVGDPYVELALLAQRTSRIKLGTGVTNPVTRHPAVAVAAAAIASLQVESGGRAVLGVGRGDSALAQLGLPSATTADLTRYIDAVRTYSAATR